MRKPADCMVIGGGVIGCSIALRLQRDGYQVLLADAALPGRGASAGNAGMTGPGSIIPVIPPDLLKKLPSLLTGRRKSVVIRASNIIKASRWLFSCLKVANPDRYLQSSQALTRLHRNTLNDWQILIGESAFSELFQVGDTVSLIPGNDPAQVMNSAVVQLRRAAGVQSELAQSHLLSRQINGLSFEDSVATVIRPGAAVRDSAKLLDCLLSQFLCEGGQLCQEQIQGINFNGPTVSSVFTTHSLLNAEKYIVAAGADSLKLLPESPLKIPLNAERGYHIMIKYHTPLFNPHSADRPGICVIHDAGYRCVITPMSEGIRVSGFAEYCRPGQPAKRDCYDRLEQFFRHRFPDYPVSRISEWYGDRPVTPDSLPCIGYYPDVNNLLCAFGHGHYGMSGAPATANLIAGLISKKINTTNNKTMAMSFRLERFSFNKAERPDAWQRE